MGVFPYISLAELEGVFTPIITELKQVLGIEIQFRSSSSFERFKVRLFEEAYDIAFIQPFDYVQVAALIGYRPVANINMPLSAVLVTTVESGVEKITDLKHQMIALPPRSAAVTHLVKRMLKQNKVELEQHIKIKHEKTHDACLQQLLLGAVSACGTAPYPMALFEKQMGVKFRILKESEKIPGSLFVVHQSVPLEDFRKIQNTLVTISSDIAGTYWGSMGLTQPFKSVADDDFNILRRILAEE